MSLSLVSTIKRMANTMKRWLAEKLCPEMAREARQYWSLWHRIDDAQKWCCEFPQIYKVTSWVLDGHRDYWRQGGAEPISKFPSRIDAFREELRREAKLSTTGQTEDKK